MRLWFCDDIVAIVSVRGGAFAGILEGSGVVSLDALLNTHLLWPELQDSSSRPRCNQPH